VTETARDGSPPPRFLADKRAKKLQELLKRPGYAAWWATRLCDAMGTGDRAGPLGGERG
jgi:hypothetical protein